MANTMAVPCMGCTERHMHCHAHCEKYKAFSKARNEYLIEHNKEVRNISYQVDRAYKAKKNWERKKSK